jgi:uncharacterized protein (TIGR02611 family)
VRAVPGGWVLWRIAVTVAGSAIIAIGIVLLPLPGPGWVIIFGGLGLLATEYRWAAAVLAWVKRGFAAWAVWMGRQPRWAQWLVGALGLLTLAAIAFGIWWFAYR